jgi:hypothetical protein
VIGRTCRHQISQARQAGSRATQTQESFITKRQAAAFFTPLSIGGIPTDAYLNPSPHNATFTSLMAILELLQRLYQDFLNAASQLDFSLSPSVTFAKLRAHKFTWAEIIEYVSLAVLATFWLALMPESTFPLNLLIPSLYVTALIIPATTVRPVDSEVDGQFETLVSPLSAGIAQHGQAR